MLQTILIVPSSNKLCKEFKYEFSICIHISDGGALDISKITSHKQCARIKHLDSLALVIDNIMRHC